MPSAPPAPPAPSATLALALTPAGALELDPQPDAAETLEPQVAARITAGFARGAGAGLLHLGTAEADTALPPVAAYFRNFATRFVSVLRATPELEAVRTSVEPIAPTPDELGSIAAGAPPMRGGEYLTPEVLAALWAQTAAAFRAEMTGYEGTVQAWLRARNPAWSVVGRVCLHLAENKREGAPPFAFLATYTTRMGAGGRAQHRPLGDALREYGAQRDRAALLALLEPVHAAAEKSELVRALLESGELFRPLAWGPREAYRFLQETLALEAAGIVVRVPDWWRARTPPRPQLRVTVGSAKPGRVGADALLDLDVALVVDGEPLTDAERAALLANTEGLALVRGKWVAVDRDRLAALMAHWKTAQRAAREGVPFGEAMRLLAGAAALANDGDEASGAAGSDSDTRAVAGPWLAQVLSELRSPEGVAAADPGDALRAELRPYQKAGVRWLWTLYRLGLGGCLADDMGLGKTVQVLALLLLARRHGATNAGAKGVGTKGVGAKGAGAKGAGTPAAAPGLVVAPASLLANWRAEAARFAPSLRVLVLHPSGEAPAARAARPAPTRFDDVDVVLTSYGTLVRAPFLTETTWDLVVCDEAQALKNPSARQTGAAKALRANVRLALSGTPVENHLTDLWSVLDFAQPGLLGSIKQFGAFARRLSAEGGPGFAPLRELVRPYVLRRTKTDKSVIADLPDKTEVRAYCSLTRLQAAQYERAVADLEERLRTADGIERRGVVLASLMRLKQICNHPSQWLGDGKYAPDASGKYARLREVCEPIAARQERALVFTQFREMAEPLADYLATLFGRPGLVLHGGTAVAKRKGLVDQFQRADGPPFMVLSVKAGGVGLNLTNASHVVHFDRWWNPAVENQATDRAFRIGQTRNVMVHKFVCRGTVEERIDALIEDKKALAGELLGGDAAGGELLLTEMSDADLLRVVALDVKTALDEG